jgi:hypothetical protein
MGQRRSGQRRRAIADGHGSSNLNRRTRDLPQHVCDRRMLPCAQGVNELRLAALPSLLEFTRLTSETNILLCEVAALASCSILRTAEGDDWRARTDNDQVADSTPDGEFPRIKGRLMLTSALKRLVGGFCDIRREIRGIKLQFRRHCWPITWDFPEGKRLFPHLSIAVPQPFR